MYCQEYDKDDLPENSSLLNKSFARFKSLIIINVAGPKNKEYISSYLRNSSRLSLNPPLISDPMIGKEIGPGGKFFLLL